MKKIIFALISLIFSASLHAQNEVKQVLIPRDVFIADLGQIQFSFYSSFDYFKNADKKQIKDGRLYIDSEKMSSYLVDKEICKIQETVLERSGNGNYALLISLIPWKAEEIRFKEFYLEDLCENHSDEEASENRINASPVFLIKLKPVKILSLVDKLNEHNLRPAKSPATLPGTNYFLWGFSILGVLLISGIFIVIIKFPQITSKYRKIAAKNKFRKNARDTCRRLKIILRKKLDDKDFAQEVQIVVRKYLEFRFNTSFASVTVNRMFAKIQEVTGNMMSESAAEAAESIVSFFVRTNYIRFASGSIDSRRLPAEEHQASFLPGERTKMIITLRKAINRLEKGGEEND